MRDWLHRVAWAAGCALLLAPPALIAQTKTVALQKIDLSRLPRVELYLTVTDEKNRSVLGLTDQELAATVDDAPQKILSVKSALTQGQALTVALVIDRSGSMSRAMAEAKTAAVEFSRRLSLGDRLAVISFDDTTSLDLALSQDRGQFEQAIDRITLGRDTSLFDAVQKALDVLQASAGPRQAVVILSDGKDNRSVRTKDEILAEVNGLSIPLFTIGLGPGIDETVLAELASRTGGHFFKAAAAEDLLRLYQAIAEQLTNQYILSFDLASGLDEKWHSLKVFLKTAAGEQAFAAKPFIATTGPGVSRPTLQRLEQKVERSDAIEKTVLGAAGGLLLGTLVLLVLGLVRRPRPLPVLASVALVMSFVILGGIVGFFVFSMGGLAR
jgi:VWFA-related protein